MASALALCMILRHDLLRPTHLSVPTAKDKPKGALYSSNDLQVVQRIFEGVALLFCYSTLPRPYAVENSGRDSLPSFALPTV